MKIEIRNFGPIDYLKFDLQKDLHLIYGKNAIGKSYATYCLYCLLKNIKNKAAIDTWAYNDYLNNKQLTTFANKIIENLPFSNKKTFVEELILFIEKELKNILLIGLENSFSNSFSSLTNLKNGYSKKNFEIIISISNNERLIFSLNNEGVLDLSYIPDINQLELLVNEEIPKLFSLPKNEVQLIHQQGKDDIYHELLNFLALELDKILKKLDFNIRDVYYLPASRSGLYQALNSFTPIIAELTQNRFFLQNKRIELPTLPEPLSDYFIDLSTIDIQHINKEFEAIITELQEQILQGEVAYNDKTKRIIYKPKGIDLELNLSEASSMVAELSPFVLYFKHIINNKYGKKQNREDILSELLSINKELEKNSYYDILFIEEPEAHLHPNVQVKLMEVFAKLSKLNIKIVITSHSDYMFNKINNLLIKKEIEEDSVMVYHLVKKTNGTVAIDDMKVTSDGIEDNNFQDITEQLYNERFSYLETHVD